VYGEGPSTQTQDKGQFGGLRDVPNRGYTAQDFRFTKSKDGKILYAFCLGTPTGESRIISLGRNSKLAEKAVASVQLFGTKQGLDWKQESDALVIKIPAKLPASPATGFKVALAK
jgi:alpha-L-fucosidase